MECFPAWTGEGCFKYDCSLDTASPCQGLGHCIDKTGCICDPPAKLLLSGACEVPMPEWFSVLSIVTSSLIILTFLVCYIYVLKRRLDSLVTTKIQYVVHIYYVLSILAHLLFTPTSGIVVLLTRLIRQSQSNASYMRYVWLNNALSGEFLKIVPGLLVLLIIVNSMDKINLSHRYQVWTMAASVVYLVLTFLYFCSCVMSPTLCYVKTVRGYAFVKAMLYVQELLFALPYLANIGTIIYLYHTSKRIIEMDYCLAILDDSASDVPVNRLPIKDNKRRQLNIVMLLRTVPMIIMVVWNIMWISLYWQRQKLLWVQLLEMLMTTIYELCNALVFVLKAK